MATVSPYATAVRLERPKPNHIKNEQDQDRVTAYWTYWDIFRNVEDAFLAVMRDDEGNEDSRRYVPSARTIIEATNRYLGVNLALTPQPLATMPDGTQTEPDEATLAQVKKLLEDFAIREELHAKFASLKRWMLIRGDAVFHLMADDTKAPGTRMRLTEIDPSNYFQITDPADPERIDGVYIVNVIDDDEGEEIVQRQEYRKTEDGITSKVSFFETDGWDDRSPRSEEDLKPVDVPSWAIDLPLVEGITLDPRITSIPVYLFRNNREGTASFGTSELQGIETLLAGINQTASDEDLTIALQGIGVYWTTSGRPRDKDGNEIDWVIAPGVMVELESKDDKIGRVEGAKDIKSLLDHSGYLENKARETTGTPDVAVGKVDVQVAQSGIALSIQMAPILSKNSEKELELAGKLNQMLHDIINMWLPVYEGVDPKGISFRATFGEPLPVNRKEALAEIIEMVKNKIISIRYAQKLVQERLGYEIPTDEFDNLVAEQTQILDSVGARMDAESGGTDPTGGTEE